MLYFKEHIQAYEIQIEAESGFSEAIWCNLESQGSKIIVGVVYRCPSISKDEDTSLHKVITHASRSEFDYMILKFIPNTKYSHLRKKHLSREAMQVIINKQRLLKAYKRTGKVEDYIKYKDALTETTNEIRESKRNLVRKLAANIKKDSKRFFAYIRSKQKVRDVVDPLKDNDGLVITKGK